MLKQSRSCCEPKNVDLHGKLTAEFMNCQIYSPQTLKFFDCPQSRLKLVICYGNADRCVFNYEHCYRKIRRQIIVCGTEKEGMNIVKKENTNNIKFRTILQILNEQV